ncbi:MAG: PUR family DNA/RNA-binding protein [Rikenellaceae bacterium]|nr:PUR family DNA/RNA-binding protein [Rikenellaceae bacterium]
MYSTFENKQDNDESGGEVYSKTVRAGKRTYFFDVKATKNDDYYLTITESRKKIGKDGTFSYDKHKIYLYKEDFSKFADGLEEVMNFIKENKPEFFNNMQTASDPSIDEEFDNL